MPSAYCWTSMVMVVVVFTLGISTGQSFVDSLDGGSDIEVILVKIGGSSITDKARKESVNEETLQWFAQTVSRSVGERYLAPSRLVDGECKKKSSPYEDDHRQVAFVIVHGAGSFGHFSAKEYGLKGQNEEPQLHGSDPISLDEERYRKSGLVKTRLSVQTLNRLVVSAFIDVGVNAVGISPCFGVPGLEAHAIKQLQPSLLLEKLVKDTVEAGLVPVLHGDACLYGGYAGILSGDTIMEILGTKPWVRNVIFITDVDGVFSEDPVLNPDAQLLRQLVVNPITRSILTEISASGSSHDHDVTGGLKTKLKSGATIAISGKNVTIVKYGSQSAEQAMSLETEIDLGSVMTPLQI